MSKTNQLMVKLDADSKAFITKAAERRKISISDYVGIVAVEQARRDLTDAEQNKSALSPIEQLEFWNALNKPPKLTPSQCQLARVMRGKQ